MSPFFPGSCNFQSNCLQVGLFNYLKRLVNPKFFYQWSKFGAKIFLSFFQLKYAFSILSTLLLIMLISLFNSCLSPFLGWKQRKMGILIFLMMRNPHSLKAAVSLSNGYCLGALLLLQFKEFELYWGDDFKICSHIFMIFEVKLE